MKHLVRYSFTILLILSALIVVPACRLRQLSQIDTTDATDTTGTTVSATTADSATATTATTTITATAPVTTTAAPTSSAAPDSNRTVAFPHTLFIGDSRSVGLKEYGKLSDATFFCSVGLNAYKITSETVEVNGFGKLKLEALLSQAQFNQVYIMLGINELGYNLESTVQKYRDLIALVQAKQPAAKIVVNSTLHVTKECNDINSGSKAIFTNERINDFNTLLTSLADNQQIFYLDLNPVFDDAAGNMTTDYAAGDGIHIKAKYYLLWRDYLDTHRIA